MNPFHVSSFSLGLDIVFKSFQFITATNLSRRVEVSNQSFNLFGCKLFSVFLPTLTFKTFNYIIFNKVLAMFSRSSVVTFTSFANFPH